MFAIIGCVLVIGAVFGGFAMEGGPFLVLMQVAEIIIICGAAMGALLISAPAKTLKAIIAKVMGCFKGAAVSGETYMDLLKLLFEVFQISRKEGLIGLEGHIERPEASSVFSAYPHLLSQKRLLDFMCDTFRLVILGGVPPHDMESLMDSDIETQHHDGTKPGMLLQKIGDSMPGLGIVAAVLGIVITMQAIGGPAEEVGHKVAAALVGTFLGLFLSYGFIQPISTNIDMSNEEESQVYETIKAAMIAFAKGFNPIVCIEFARRTIPEDYRPSFQAMEDHVKGKK
ncbi:MAG: flagellar motor stator protein MotA [Syntrophorhabdales bacterium]